MSSVAYYLICLAAGLLAIAIASAVFVWRVRVRAQRQVQAAQLLDALARYTEWVAAQGRAVCFQAPTEVSDPALQEIGAVQQRWFPELGAQAQELFRIHLRLTQLLRTHQRMRLEDPEAWLESGQDAGFMALWREHCAVVQAMERRLVGAAWASAAPARSTSAA